MIKIEVTGNSTEELADKLLALSAVFGGKTVPAAVPSVEEKPKATKRTTPAKADEGKATDTPADTAEATGGATTTSTASAALDFDKDVAPVVIKVVGAKGKPFVTEILGQFGAGRASEVPEGQWGELLEALNAAL